MYKKDNSENPTWEKMAQRMLQFAKQRANGETVNLAHQMEMLRMELGDSADMLLNELIAALEGNSEGENELTDTYVILSHKTRKAAMLLSNMEKGYSSDVAIMMFKALSAYYDAKIASLELDMQYAIRGSYSQLATKLGNFKTDLKTALMLKTAVGYPYGISRIEDKAESLLRVAAKL